MTAATLALVGSLETLLSLEAVDKLDPLKRIAPTNQELKAQGVGNFLSGMIGGLPITAVIVRSSANIDAGAHTKVACICPRRPAAAQRDVSVQPAQYDPARLPCGGVAADRL